MLDGLTTNNEFQFIFGQSCKKGMNVMKEYRNSIRSRRLIREAFAELLAKKGSLEKVTIKEIVDRADISKSTFYAHYDNIDDLIIEIEDEFLTTIQKELDEFKDNPSKDIYPYLQSVTALLKKNETTYKLLISPGIPSLFIYKLKKLIYSNIKDNKTLIALNNNPSVRYAMINFTTSGFIALVEDYFNGSNKLSLDDICKIECEIISKLTHN